MYALRGPSQLLKSERPPHCESLFHDVRGHLFTTGIVTTRLRERAKTTPEKGPLKRRPRPMNRRFPVNRRFPGKASAIPEFLISTQPSLPRAWSADDSCGRIHSKPGPDGFFAAVHKSAFDPKRTLVAQDCCRANRSLNPISPVSNPCCNHRCSCRGPKP